MSEEKAKEEKQGAKVELDGVTKVTIERSVSEGLKELIERVNDQFEAGKVNRQDVITWILNSFLRTYDEQDVGAIRGAHFDESMMLENAYRRMRETGEVPEFLRDILRKQFQGTSEWSKKTKKGLHKQIINDGLKNEGEAA